MEELNRRKYEAEVGFSGAETRRRRRSPLSKKLAGLACLGLAVVFIVVFILSTSSCLIVAAALS